MKKNVRRGFTLPEVLVTVTVVAVLAAVVVPAVTQFASKGDSPSTKQDVSQLTTAITSFTSDVRKFPGDMRQLSNNLSSTTGSGVDYDANNSSYSNADIGKWKGPYSSMTLNPSGMFTTAGYNVQVGPVMSISSGWLQTPIDLIAGQPVDCRGLLAFDAVIDGAPSPAGAEGSSGFVRFGGTCNAATPGGTVTSPVLRLVPAS